MQMAHYKLTIIIKINKHWCNQSQSQSNEFVRDINEIVGDTFK